MELLVEERVAEIFGDSCPRFVTTASATWLGNRRFQSIGLFRSCPTGSWWPPRHIDTFGKFVSKMYTLCFPHPTHLANMRRNEGSRASKRCSYPALK